MLRQQKITEIRGFEAVVGEVRVEEGRQRGVAEIDRAERSVGEVGRCEQRVIGQGQRLAVGLEEQTVQIAAVGEGADIGPAESGAQTRDVLHGQP